MFAPVQGKAITHIQFKNFCLILFYFRKESYPLDSTGCFESISLLCHSIVSNHCRSTEELNLRGWCFRYPGTLWGRIVEDSGHKSAKQESVNLPAER